MKKFLSVLTLILALSIILGACNTVPEDTTATEDSVTEGDGTSIDSTGASSNNETTTPITDTDTDTDTETDSTSGNTTEGTTERPKGDMIVYNFSDISAKLLERCFSNPNQTEVSIGKDGDVQYAKLTTSGSTFNDPFVLFSLKSYVGASKQSAANASKYKYVMLKVKSEGITDGNFYLYYGTNKAPDIDGSRVTNQMYDVSDKDWQYIFFDLTQDENWQNNIANFRFDYTMSASGAGESILISEITFLTEDRDYYELIGIDFDDKGFDISNDAQSEADKLLSSVQRPTTKYDSYKGETAEHEDANLKVWFDHVYNKTKQNDNTGTGMISYQLMMGKNEREGMQMMVGASSDVKGLKVYVTDFKNDNGDRLTADIFWGYYFNIDGDMLVDPIVPVSYSPDPEMQQWLAGGNGPGYVFTDKQKYNGFDLNAGENQMFVIRATTTKDSPSGEYSATVTVCDSEGREVKKVTVFCYVWNFELPEATSCKTLMDISYWEFLIAYKDYNGVIGDEVYERAYNYLLENRVCGYDIPGMYKNNGTGKYDHSMMKYISNERVVAFLATGWKNDITADNASNAYNSLKDNQSFLDKAYFYPVDEPSNIAALDRINYYGQLLKENFPGYKLIAPIHLNGSVAGGDYFSYVAEAVTAWCPHTYFYTTFGEWYANKALTYRNSPSVDAKLGSFRDRMWAEQKNGDEAWWYVTRFPQTPEITLTINTDAVNYRTLFWQQKLYNVDGFLYYCVNDYANGTTRWWVNSTGEDFLYGFDPMHEVNDTYPLNVYGSGILLYAGVYFGQLDPVGCLRLECIRDGIEDFEYFTMLEEIYGEEVVDAIIYKWTQGLGEYSTDTEAFTALREQIGMLLHNASNK